MSYEINNSESTNKSNKINYLIWFYVNGTEYCNDIHFYHKFISEVYLKHKEKGEKNEKRS